MKKWMAYLPLGLLCGSLVVIGGIWGSVWNHTWSGQLELRHLKGDQSALADLNIQFGITDARQRWNFSIKDGALQKESFTLSYEEPVYGSGETIGNWKDGTMQVWNWDADFRPWADSEVETVEVTDFSQLWKDGNFPSELYDEGREQHVTTHTFEKAQVVLCVDMDAEQDKGNGFHKWIYEIPTNMQYIPEEPFVNVVIKDENSETSEFNNQGNEIEAIGVWSKSKEMLYTTLKTNEKCRGSIGLYCLGPKEEEFFGDEDHVGRPTRTEPVATLAEILISESRWVLGLEDVGEGLLVFIGEPDKVTAELYGYDGTLLDSNTMPSEEPVHEIEIQQTKWKDGRGVFVEGSQKTGENEYYVHFFTGYWVENGTIKPVYLNGNGYGTWTAVGKEKVLVMNRTMDEWDGKAEPIRGNTMNGFKISVYDITEDLAGKEVYCGELETDIDEDALEFFNYFTTKAYKQSVEHQTLKSVSSSRQLDVFSVTESAGDSV